MKKVIVLCSVAVLLGFVSCASAPVRMEFESFQGGRDVAALQLSEFSILGRVEGKGTIVYTAGSGKITGDIYKYGFI
ncbi:MAG: hypothetical protein LBC62_01455, partial [Treponema sp.]|nr:hypothetical protein [Treponema sp.]